VPFSPHQLLPRYLTQPELQAFFAAIAEPRDRALFAVIYHYGLRVGEVALLARGDVDFDRHRIVVKRLKGGFWTERPLFAASEHLLGQYLKEIPSKPSDPLFSGRTGPLGRRQIQDRFCRYRDRAGLDTRYTTHSLRHSIATHLLDAGASLEFVQDHLGHRSIRSTSIYARITDHHRVALFRKLEASPWIVDPVVAQRPQAKDRTSGRPGT
jgi:site-specific recombinase XerD